MAQLDGSYEGQGEVLSQANKMRSLTINLRIAGVTTETDDLVALSFEEVA